MSAIVLNHHWENPDNESMYDKHWLATEMALISHRIKPGARIFEIGCGDGECTRFYAETPGVQIDACDTSRERLERFVPLPANVKTHWLDVRCDFPSWAKDYDHVISQRCIINVTESWAEQKRCLERLAGLLKVGGTLLLMEGSKAGQRELNRVRKALGLEPIVEKSHNRFLEDKDVRRTLTACGLYGQEKVGLGDYHLLTRAIQPYFVKQCDWQSDFNKRASSSEMSEALGMGSRFARVKLWVYARPA